MGIKSVRQAPGRAFSPWETVMWLKMLGGGLLRVDISYIPSIYHIYLLIIYHIYFQHFNISWDNPP